MSTIEEVEKKVDALITTHAKYDKENAEFAVVRAQTDRDLKWAGVLLILIVVMFILGWYAGFSAGSTSVHNDMLQQQILNHLNITSY
jgi:hypothetical protein